MIAPHLRAARSVDQPWGVQVLQDAAEEVLADDEVRLAIAYLELAHRCCADAQHCAAIRIRIAVLMRRRNPSGRRRSPRNCCTPYDWGGWRPGTACRW
ncbi:hypothetical protein SAZ11_45195 [Streptomyces sp. FXJ1.4098]|nr:hypothetical protein [Streptomyces sp. FXJ1.4098]